jgi:fumarate reductase subunit C
MARRRRRRGSRIDWFEVVTAVLGLLFAVLSVICLVSLITVLASLGDPQEGFPTGLGFLQGVRGIGLALVAVGAVVFGLVAWWLLADRVRAMVRRREE